MRRRVGGREGRTRREARGKGEREYIDRVAGEREREREREGGREGERTSDGT